jgi:cystathionine beta-lyase/cystathionine gamma-synthase
MNIETITAHAGLCTDETTGSISTPIYQTAAFRHTALGVSTGYDYSRTANPTRKALENVMAELERGDRGFAFASGMAALTAILMIFETGDHLLVSDDLYGGTYRLLEKNFKQFGIDACYVDTNQTREIEQAIIPGKTKAILIETPTNPLMKITDLRKVIALAKQYGLITIVDNTFMTPYLQRPIEFGADIVIHSATKYLGGHNDVLGGIVVTRTPFLSERIGFIQNSTGGVLGPQDSWLMLRGIKTLAIRIDRQESNALKLAQWLYCHPAVKRIYYPGLQDHPGHQLQREQCTGFGAMIAFEVTETQLVEQIINRVKVLTFAESLGGVETLITYPVRQTHGDIPVEVRERTGITDKLLRISVGIEDSRDLIKDLEQAIG